MHETRHACQWHRPPVAAAACAAAFVALAASLPLELRRVRVHLAWGLFNGA